MATQKPSKPNVTLPNNFGGIKTPYTQAQIDNGYQEAVPQVVDGGNINYEKDGVFQKLKYLESVADAVNNIPAGKFLVVNSNNQFDYEDSSVKSSFGNIGDINHTTSTEVPLGGAWCDGTLYTKAQFPDVYQMLVDGKLQSTTVSKFDSTVSANGSCGFFGLDTVNERFKVPMLKDVYLKAGQAPSMFGGESLPNIEGTMEHNGAIRSHATQEVNRFTGAFYRKSTQNNSIPSSSGGVDECFALGFDASRSSSTYRNNTKVNPDHVVYRAYVVLYATAAEASEAQAAEFINGLANKANVDLSNVSGNVDYVVESYNDGTNWYKVYKSGWIEQSGVIDNGSQHADWNKVVNLLKPLSTPYTLVVTDLDSTNNFSRACSAKILTETSFTILSSSAWARDTKSRYACWRACGQGA